MGFYQSKDWKSIRSYKLTINPFCERCFKNGKLVAAVDVHHIIEVKKDTTKALDINNLESLCKKCHSTHTATHQKYDKNEVKNSIFKF